MFHKRTIKASQDNGQRYKWGAGTRALSRLQYFFDTCPLLCKFVQDCVKDPEHNLEYLMLSCPNWNLRVHHDRYTCVNALRSLSGSKPFLMIEWGTPLEHTWPSPDHHIWATNGRLFPFSNYLARLPTIDRPVLLR